VGQRWITKLKRRPVNFDDAKDPVAWQNVSKRLLVSAEILWAPLEEAIAIAKKDAAERTAAETQRFSELADQFGAFFVIAGLAVENALKAAILRRTIRNGAVIDSGLAALKVLPTTDHNLVLLADKAGVALTPGTTRLLERLSIYVKWAGRYPIPKDPKKAGVPRDTRENDWSDIQQFLARIPK
jgi:hypothetical protein